MSFASTVLLGAISGLTIVLGMPVARLSLQRKYVLFLNALAGGILLFLFVDIMKNALEPVETALEHQSPQFPLLVAVLIGGFCAGFLTILTIGHMHRSRKSGGTYLQLAFLIAIAIGLHNFAEGLAIGNAAVRGDLHFALLLICGFSLHNIAEAFSISAFLVGRKSSWGLLFLLSLIAGGPNTIGTIIGYSLRSDMLSLLFLSLSAGGILFVINETIRAGGKPEEDLWNGWGLALGFVIAFLTELLLVYAGA